MRKKDETGQGLSIYVMIADKKASAADLRKTRYCPRIVQERLILRKDRFGVGCPKASISNDLV